MLCFMTDNCGRSCRYRCSRVSAWEKWCTSHAPWLCAAREFDLLTYPLCRIYFWRLHWWRFNYQMPPRRLCIKSLIRNRVSQSLKLTIVIGYSGINILFGVAYKSLLAVYWRRISFQAMSRTWCSRVHRWDIRDPCQSASFSFGGRPCTPLRNQIPCWAQWCKFHLLIASVKQALAIGKSYLSSGLSEYTGILVAVMSACATCLIIWLPWTIISTELVLSKHRFLQAVSVGPCNVCLQCEPCTTSWEVLLIQ